MDRKTYVVTTKTPLQGSPGSGGSRVETGGCQVGREEERKTMETGERYRGPRTDVRPRLLVLKVLTSQSFRVSLEIRLAGVTYLPLLLRF